MLTINLASLPVLETSRLVLREHSLADAAPYLEMRSDELIMKYIDRPRYKDLDESKTVLQSLIDGFYKRTNLLWAIELKDSPGKMIGNLGFWRTELENHRAELGYILHSDYWRKGILTEALTAVIEFAFTTIGLHSISANINPDNVASRQLLLKHGFEKEAYHKENYYFNGKFLDSELYGLLNPYHKA
ncbi:GNAT family N-acetyltransferase [Pedobacter sp. PWIIR3]